MRGLFDWLFSVDGRAPRWRWWLVRLVGLPAVFLVLVIIAALMGDAWQEPASLAIVGAGLGFYLAVDLTTTVRRWHDRGCSGLMCLILLVPLIGAIWTLVECGFLDGTAGSNEYGPSPKRPASKAGAEISA